MAKKNIDKWKRDIHKDSGDPRRGVRGGRPKAKDATAEPTHPSTLPKGQHVTDLRIEGDLDLSYFDDLEPDQGYVVNPTGVAPGDVLVAVAPSIDGQPPTWSATTPTVTFTTDGAAPTDAPTDLTLYHGVAMIIARWTGSSNPDPVTYEVHAIPDAERDARTGDATWVPDAASYVGEIEGNQFTIRNWPEGIVGASGRTVPDYDELIYVKVVPKDADGIDYSSASDEAISWFVQVAGADIAVENVTANHIIADQAFFDLIGANLIDANEIVIGDAAGRHVRIKEGGVFLENADEAIVSLPTNGDPAVFRGQIIADELSVIDGATFRGTANALEEGASFVLAASQNDPVIAPTVTQGLDSLQFANAPWALDNTNGIFYDATNTSFWRLTRRSSTGNFHVQEFNDDGEYIRTKDLNNATGWNIIAATGVVRLNDFVYTTVYRFSFGAPSDGHYLLELNESDLTLNTSTKLDSILTVDSVTGLGVNAAGTHIIVSDWTAASSAQVRLQFYQQNVPGPPSFSSTTDLSGATARTAADWTPQGVIETGGKYYVGLRSSASGTDIVEAYDSGTGALVSNQEFYTDQVTSDLMCGFFHDGTNFGFCRQPNTKNANLYYWTDYLAGVSLTDNMWLAYRWDDGSHHTTVSALASFPLATARRQRYTITVPTPPSGMVSQIFALNNTSTPAATSLKRQTATTNIDTESGTAIVIKAYDASGTALGTDSNDFGAGNSELTAGGAAVTTPWSLTGQGELVLPTATVAQRTTLGDTDPGSVIVPTTLYTPTIYDGERWWPVGMPALPKGTYVYDDMLYPDLTNTNIFGAFSATQGSAGGTPPSWVQSGTSGHPGVITITIGNGTTAEARITTGDLWWLGQGMVRYGFLIKTPSNRPTTAQNYKMAIGLAESHNTDPLGAAVNQCEFTIDRIDDSNMRLRGRVNDGGTANTVDLDTSLAQDTWKWLECEINAAGTSVQFYVDGVATGSAVTTRIPTGSALALRISCVKTAGTTSRNLPLDCVYLVQHLTTPR